MVEPRDVVAVVVAVENPADRLVGAVSALSAHLPPSDRPTVRPLCPARPWPRMRSDEAARRVHEGGAAIGSFVPLDLHPRLWPPAELVPLP
ncbi:hypothetical protein [Nocardia sp. NRRL S-836]|uniref:hypothetical protein n=1 Tax=Nocardia sp. NRRL S-836 TaxID=1519492 RepID=UPI0006AF1EA2|nr:hypothetical protein [Nocardia sp. NRRL S-836]KOV84643.1 hypothetical protein ADL03_15230 [Nocardia sp. NRRL S-836]